MREIYLDNSATTRPFDEVRAIMNEVMDVEYGNPSSMHQKGVEAEKYITAAKKTIAGVLKVSEKELIFTSCGTEADNLAIIGGAMANKRAGNHLITTMVEHPAVLQSMAFLEEQGFRVTYLPVDEKGRVRIEEVEAAICPETILISMMYVNNEVGSVMPIEEVAAVIARKNPKILFHVDAVQAFGKFQIRPKKMGIDLLSVSGHKIHGPKGIGVLYASEKVRLHPLMLGGGQQKGMRSGTENVPGIAGIGKATEIIYKTLSEDAKRLYELKEYFATEVLKIGGTVINGAYDTTSAPHVISVSIDDCRAEVMLHALEAKGIYVSSGSACASNKPSISATLKAMGVPQKHYDATLRFSLSVFTTKEDLELTLEALREIIPIQRRFVRK